MCLECWPRIDVNLFQIPNDSDNRRDYILCGTAKRLGLENKKVVPGHWLP